MSQLSYSTYQGLPFAGVLADNGDKSSISGINEEASANFPFGIAVKQGTADKGVKLPAASADVTTVGTLLGVTMHTHQVDPAQVAASPAGAGVPPKYAVAVLTKGRIYVVVEEAVTPADPVFVRYATGTGTQLGAFRKSADTATAAAAPTTWRYRTSASAGGIAELEVNLP